MLQLRIFGTFLLAALIFLAPQPATAGSGMSPSFDTMSRIVLSQFARRDGFQRGDLISQRDVEPIFDQLRQVGWEPADAEAVFDSFLPDNALLVRELESEAGRKFMRKISKFPGVYDRLERLSWLSDGPQILQRLIHDPQGVEQLRLMTTPAGMKKVEERVAKDPRGANFSLPSGRIHTVDELLKALHEAQTAENERRTNSSE